MVCLRGHGGSRQAHHVLLVGGGWSFVSSVPNGEEKHSRAETATLVYEVGDTAVARRQ